MRKHTIHFLGAAALAFFSQAALAQSIPEGLSIDTDYTENEPGYYYINLPHLGQNPTCTTLDLSQSGGVIHSFKVYNEEGKNAVSQDHGNTDANLRVIAPDGYILQVTGTVTAPRSGCYMRFYDAETYSREAMYKYKYSFGNSKGEDVGLLYTTSNKMYLHYHTFAKGGGLDLTVTLVKASDEHTITANGAAVASPTSAAAATTVTVTATPDAGYLPNGFVASDAEGHSIPVEGGWYSSNTGTLIMPGKDITVTPVLTDKLSAEDGGLYVTIPYYSESESEPKVANIPDGIESFKVYEYSASPDGCYEQQNNGYLLLNAPSGKILELSGAVQCQTIYDGLSVYDGNTTAKQLGKKQLYGNSEANGDVLDVMYSSGNQMLIKMYSQHPDERYWGADLTVRVIDPAIKHTIEVKSADHGSVTASLAEAGTSEVVSLTVTPDKGYYLNELLISDENGIAVTSTGGLWYSNDKTAHFQMPSSKATVTPVFETAENLHIVIPSTADRDHTFRPNIPGGVLHFKVYCEKQQAINTYVTIKTPIGYIPHLTGNIEMTNNYYDYLKVYNGDAYDYNKNPKYFYGNNSASTPVDYLATDRYVTFYCMKNVIDNRKGLDLTVELVAPEEFNLFLTGTKLNGSSGVYIPISTFYLEDSAIELPEGCQAFTLNSDYSLSLVGDGRIVPAACPVIIIANKSEISVKRTSKTATPEAGNILIGVSSNTEVENVYTLFRSSFSVLQIGKFSGTIPAGKAYIIK